MIPIKSHPDGDWQTTEFEYRGYKYMIKSKKGYGIKSHVFNPNTGQVMKTNRYSFILPEKLHNRVHFEIDRIIEKLLSLEDLND